LKHLLFTILVISASSSSFAASAKEKAIKMHNRLTGVPPQADVLTSMESFIKQGIPEDAAELALENKNFINVVMKNWVKPWSNVDQTSRVPLNDYVATILGAIKDDIPFDRILYDDILYTVEGVTPDYSNKDNLHYIAAEEQRVDLSTKLVQRKQSDVTKIAATSGVLTTRAAGEAFFSAGTNRRVNRFTFINYLCNDFEDLHDTAIPDYRVRRDVERNPGNDSRTYKNNCVGCHAGQDGLAGAYNYYNFSGDELTYTPGKVTPKVNQNISFKDGFKDVDDSWINLWVIGNNAKLGWKGATSGSGASSLNRMFARSDAFAQCMSKKVFKLVCMKDPISTVDKKLVETHARSFGADFNLKSLIVKTSVGCIANE